MFPTTAMGEKYSVNHHWLWLDKLHDRCISNRTY